MTFFLRITPLIKYTWLPAVFYKDILCSNIISSAKNCWFCKKKKKRWQLKCWEILQVLDIQSHQNRWVFCSRCFLCQNTVLRWMFNGGMPIWGASLSLPPKKSSRIFLISQLRMPFFMLNWSWCIILFTSQNSTSQQSLQLAGTLNFKLIGNWRRTSLLASNGQKRNVFIVYLCGNYQLRSGC